MDASHERLTVMYGCLERSVREWGLTAVLSFYRHFVEETGRGLEIILLTSRVGRSAW